MFKVPASVRVQKPRSNRVPDSYLANWRQEALIHSRPLINHDLMGGKQRDVISSKALNTALNSTSEAMTHIGRQRKP